MFKIGDRIIINDVESTHYGRVGTIRRFLHGIRLSEIKLDNIPDLQTFSVSTLAPLPGTLYSDAKVEPETRWATTIELINGKTEVVLTSCQPSITWSNGMIKLDLGDNIKIYQINLIHDIDIRVENYTN